MKQIILICICLMMISCSSGSKKSFQKLYYRFPEPQTIDSLKPLDVSMPTALGIFANRPLVAVDTNGALKQMNYSFWLESPKILMNNYLIKLFNGQHLPNKNNDRLLTQILQFEKQQNLAVIKIKFKVVSPEGQVKHDRTYKKQIQSKDISVAQFVKAIGQLIHQVTDELIEDIQ